MFTAVSRFANPGTTVGDPPAGLEGSPTAEAHTLVRDTRRRLGDLRYSASAPGRATLRLLNEMRDSERGQTGVIVGSGPSLAVTDVSVLEEHPYIVMNRGYRIAEQVSRKPSVLCAHDPDVIRHFREDLGSLDYPVWLTRQSVALVSHSKRIGFLRLQSRWRFATRLGLSIHHGYTAMFWALQAGYHLGWSRALIVGMDHNHSGASQPSAYDRVGAVDTNHYAHDYFPPGMQLKNPVLQGNEYSYALARHAWAADGREIVDCTPAGKCTVFRKSSLEMELSRSPRE